MFRQRSYSVSTNHDKTEHLTRSVQYHPSPVKKRSKGVNVHKYGKEGWKREKKQPHRCIIEAQLQRVPNTQQKELACVVPEEAVQAREPLM